MKRMVLAFVVAAALGSSTVAEERNAGGKQAFEKMKALVGRWEATSSDGSKQTLDYELVSGGSALLERENPHSMVTLYHLDGDALRLTHYCAAGNQPRMRAAAYDPASRTVVFEFVDVTNLAGPNAGHMRRAVFRFLDENRFVSEWTFRKDGKDAAEKFDCRRKN